MKNWNGRVAAVAALVTVALFAGGCSSKKEDEAASGSGDQTETTRTTLDSAALKDEMARVTKYLSEAEKRGEPKLEAVEVPTDLVITDDVVGTGREVKEGDTVTVHYVGAAASTGKVFDSSWSRGEPLTFPLDGVIEGWSKGLIGMKEGGRRTLVIPAAMAYGNGGPAPGDALVFTIDLLRVKKG